MKKLNMMIVATGIVLMFNACASKKAIVDTQTAATTTTGTTTTSKATQTQNSSAAFVKKVADTQVYAKNVVSDLSFNVKMGSKDITVPGSLHMRRNEVIRLQLFIPLLGTEVARLEFTPNGVLIIDRMHKEYIEGDYTQLDFLKKNGLNFYSLQALFWNQLLVPGETSVTDKDLTRFEVGSGQQNVKLENGNMTYNWTTQPQTGQIVMTNVAYASAKNGASSLLWQYSDFKPMGTKYFPARQEFQFSTTATKQMKTVKVILSMDDPKDKADWDAKTTVSSRYKKVEAADVLGKLLNF